MVIRPRLTYSMITSSSHLNFVRAWHQKFRIYQNTGINTGTNQTNSINFIPKKNHHVKQRSFKQNQQQDDIPNNDKAYWLIL
jgi:hypothetical protein